MADSFEQWILLHKPHNSEGTPLEQWQVDALIIDGLEVVA